MGILEEINSKLDRLLAGEAGSGSATVGDKPETAAARKKREAAEKEASKPAFTAEQLRDKFLEVQSKHGDAVAKELISEMGHDKLAKLIADAGNWQKYWDAAEAKLAEEVEEDNGGL